MKLEVVGESFIYRWPGGQIRFEPGRVIDVEEGRARRILAKAPGRVRPVGDAPSAPALKPGNLVEWQSPALFAQRGEVLAISGDYFEAYHPVSECVCRMPTCWITRVVMRHGCDGEKAT